MPGQKDIVSVKTNEDRCLMQKCLFLLDSRGLYDKYKESHPEFPASFQKIHTTSSETLHSCWAQRNPFRLRLHDPSK